MSQMDPIEFGFRPANTKKKSRFTVEAGRQIYRDGKPFISINREGNTQPTEADTVTNRVATFLNGVKKK